MKLQWVSIIFILLILVVFEIVIYIFYLIIKALRIYIDSNSEMMSEKLPKVRTRKSMKGVFIMAVCNVLIIVAIIATVYIQRKHDIYYTENVIICQNKSGAEKFTKILDETDINYDVLDGTRVKMQNGNDFLEAVDIIQDNRISFSTVTIEH